VDWVKTTRLVTGTLSGAGACWLARPRRGADRGQLGRCSAGTVVFSVRTGLVAAAGRPGAVTLSRQPKPIPPEPGLHSSTRSRVALVGVWRRGSPNRRRHDPFRLMSPAARPGHSAAGLMVAGSMLSPGAEPPVKPPDQGESLPPVTPSLTVMTARRPCQTGTGLSVAGPNLPKPPDGRHRSAATEDHVSDAGTGKPGTGHAGGCGTARQKLGQDPDKIHCLPGVTQGNTLGRQHLLHQAVTERWKRSR